MNENRKVADDGPVRVVASAMVQQRYLRNDQWLLLMKQEW